MPAARQRRDFLCHTAGLRRPFRPDLRGASGQKGLGWSPGLWHLSAGAGDPGRRDPVPGPGDPGAAARGGAEGRCELPGGSQGRCFAGRYRGSAPVRGAGRPLAGRAICRGPMTTRPNPSRLGSRVATQESPRRLYCCGHCGCSRSSLTLPGHRLPTAFLSVGPSRNATGARVSKRQKRVRGTRGHRGREDPGSSEHGNLRTGLRANQLCRRRSTSLLS